MVYSMYMGVWPFSMFEGKTSEAPKTEEQIKEGERPVLLSAEKEAEKIYKREVWWLEHKTGLKRWSIIVVIFIEVLLGAIGLYAFVDYYLVDYVEEQRLVSTFFEGAEDLRNSNFRQTPDDLLLEPAVSVQSGQRFDLLSFVENTNTDWVARLEYHFEYSGMQSETKSVVVNHQTRLALSALGLQGIRPRVQNLVVDSIDWQKIDHKDIKDPVLWKTERWNLEIDNFEHHTNLVIGSRSFGRTTFEVRNKTGFGYYEIPITVVLRRGNSIVGVNKTTMSNFRGLENRVVQVDWFDNTPSALTVEAFPELDLFDEDNYMPKTAEEELHRIDTRTQI